MDDATLNGILNGLMLQLADVQRAIARLTVQQSPSSDAALANVGTQKVGLAAVNGVAVSAMRSDAAPPIDQAMTPTWTGGHTFNADVTHGDGDNIVLGTSTGSKIGSATNQKLGFWNAAPIAQPSGDLISALGSEGLIASPVIAYGALYGSGLTQTITISVSNTWYSVGSGPSIGGASSYITLYNGGLKTTLAGVYLATWSMSLQCSVSTQNVGGSIMINSTESTQAEAFTQLISQTITYSIGGTAIVSLAANDVVYLCTKNVSGTNNLTLKYANLSLARVG